MKSITLTAALLLALVGVVAAQGKSANGVPPALEAKERQLWDAFQKKDKATLSSLLDDDFHMFEEGLPGIVDKKAEVNSVDDFELLSYTLSNFTVKSIGPNSALVTYIAQYEGKSGGETSKAKSVFAEVWIHTGAGWKDVYLQETYVK